MCRNRHILVSSFYEYDNKVWGHDRALFAEETLYYPYCDSEDRSIVFKAGAVSLGTGCGIGILGVSIGETMDCMDNKTAKVILLSKYVRLVQYMTNGYPLLG